MYEIERKGAKSLWRKFFINFSLRYRVIALDLLLHVHFLYDIDYGRRSSRSR